MPPPIKQMPLADYAALQERMGVKIVRDNDRYWRRVRPLFYRPLLPVEPYDPAEVRRPVAWPGAYQFAVPAGAAGNSSMSFLTLDEPSKYSLDGLSHKRRQLIKRAAREFEVKRLSDATDLKARGHAAYLSFFERTRYPYRSDRRAKPVFDAWVDALMANPYTIVLAGYGPHGLVAFSSAYWVSRTLVYSTLICDSDSLRLNVGELIFHELQLLASREPGISQILVRNYQAGNSLDQYYLHRGCRLKRLPAWTVISRPVQKFVRWFMPRNYELIFGEE